MILQAVQAASSIVLSTQDALTTSAEHSVRTIVDNVRSTGRGLESRALAQGVLDLVTHLLVATGERETLALLENTADSAEQRALSLASATVNASRWVQNKSGQPDCQC
jgi:hypothetical protein